MRIAMVVHNDVKHDARVMKEANSLREAGHDVTVFGLTGDLAALDFSFGPFDTPVVLSYRSEVGIDNTLLTGLPGKLADKGRYMADALNSYMYKTAYNKPDRIRRSFTYQGAILADAVCRTFTPDVVHIHDHVALTGAAIYKHVLDVPIVWDAHEIYEALAGTNSERGQANADVISQNAPYVDQFITINNSIAGFYADKYKPLSQATVLPNASLKADLPDYDGRLHDAAGLDRDQKILLFQGRMSPHRGIVQLVEAALSFPDDWSLVFMGWGELKDKMEALSVTYPMTQTGNQRVCFIDGAPQQELQLWTAGASLGAIPYENTGLNHLYCTPNKLWEYPLAGVPILASSLEELGRFVRTHNTGKLIPRNFSASDIVQVVNELNDDDLIAMRKACALYAETQNWQAIDHRLINVYEKLLALDVESGMKKFDAQAEVWPVPSSVKPSAKFLAKATTSNVNKTMKSLEIAPSKGSLGTDMAARSKVGLFTRAIRAGKRRLKLMITGGAAERRAIAKLKKQIHELNSRPQRERYTNNVKVLKNQINTLKKKLEDSRQRFRMARVDQRDVSPIEHNTKSSMDKFFAENGAEDPYLDFAASLGKLLTEQNVTFDEKTVLDVGVGPAVMLQALLCDSKPESIAGLDFSSVAIEKAKERIPGGMFEVADIYKAISHQADVALCTEVLEHLEKPDLALKNVLDAVKPGGLAVLTVPDGRVDYSLYHVNFWSPESWKSFVDGAAGDADVEVGKFRVRESSAYKNNYAVIRKSG